MSMSYVRWFWLVVVLLMVGACEGVPEASNDVAVQTKYREKLATTAKNPMSQLPLDPFSDRLKRGYIQLSDDRWQQDDKEGAKFFAQKALGLIRGEPVMPTSLDELDLSAKQMDELDDANQFLDIQMIGGLRKHFPEGAAQAQLMYDCWVEEELDTHQLLETKNCKLAFQAVRQDINQYLKNPSKFRAENPELFELAVPEKKIAMPPSSAKPADRRPANTMPVQTQMIEIGDRVILGTEEFSKTDMPPPYVIYFGYDQVTLTPAGKGILDLLIRDVETFKPDKLLITGHADRSGKSEYNLALAEKRVWAMINYLRAKGVEDRLFDDLRSYGENRQAVSTPDGAKNPKNRYGFVQFLKRSS